MLRYLTANNCDPGPRGRRSHDIRTGLCAALNSVTFLCSPLRVHVCGWMTGSWQKNCYTEPTTTSTQRPKTASSPVQVTQPSSTQESFAKSKRSSFSVYPSVSLCLSVFASPLAVLSQAGRRCPRRLHEVKVEDGGRAVRGLTDGWGSRAGCIGMERCLALNATPLKSPDPLEQCRRYTGFVAVVVTSTLLLKMFLCVTVGHTPLEGEEMSYFTNIVVHNI